MADRERRRNRDQGPERDRYFERRQRWIGSGYWTNEPGFQDSRRESEEGDREHGRGYDDEDYQRYREEAVDQSERLRRMRGQPDEFENDEFYANRGWARSAARETDRDWGYYNNEDYGRDNRLEVDFYRDRPASYHERDFGRGMDAMRGQAHERGRGQDDLRSSSQSRGGWNEEERRNERREEWDVPGPHRGKGPRGYQRSDERISEEICERLTKHGMVDATGIEIRVENGEVFLHGEVDRKKEKLLAEDLAASVDGVKDVTNRLRVSPSDGVRVRGMGRENLVMPGRIQIGMRVMGIDGKFAGVVRRSDSDSFIMDYQGREIRVPFQAIRRTNGVILLSIPADEISRQNWQRF